MDKFLETVMNFINENTTLLIIICVFLIFVLIGYLIDNSIKTKKLARSMKEESNNDSVTPIENEIPISKPVENVETKPIEEEIDVQKEEVKEVIPTVEPEPAIEPAPIVEPIIPEDSNTNDLDNFKIDLNIQPIDNTIEIEKPIENNIELEKPVEKSPYKNDKKLSEILGKKSEPVSNDVNTSQDDELDKILKKLNEAVTSNDSTLEETTDFTNMF